MNTTLRQDAPAQQSDMLYELVTSYAQRGVRLTFSYRSGRVVVLAGETETEVGYFSLEDLQEFLQNTSMPQSQVDAIVRNMKNGTGGPDAQDRPLEKARKAGRVKKARRSGSILRRQATRRFRHQT